MPVAGASVSVELRTTRTKQRDGKLAENKGREPGTQASIVQLRNDRVRLMGQISPLTAISGSADCGTSNQGDRNALCLLELRTPLAMSCPVRGKHRTGFGMIRLFWNENWLSSGGPSEIEPVFDGRG
jgi:hypothetical protein